MFDNNIDPKAFNEELSKIKDKKYKKELVKYIEDQYNLDLSSKECKKKLSQTDEQRWDALSNEKKFEEAASNLPFAMMFYMIEAAIVVGGLIICL